MIEDKMQIAKGRLGLYAGFWLAMASRMEWKPGTPMGGVAMTDGKRVIYNRENLNARPMGDVVFIALHEIMHPMLCHLTRRGNRDRQVYGWAIDCVGNMLLKKVAAETKLLAMTVPSDALFGSAFGLREDQVTNVEQTYELLMKKCKPKAGDKPKMFDEHGDPTDGMTETQVQSMEKEWKIAVQAAAQMAKDQGKLPGYLEEFIGELLKPKVDWRSQLWAATKIAKDESSYRKFNRKFVHDGIYLPGNYSERIGAMAYFCDTSGSISTEEFKQAMSEMVCLLEELKPERIYFGQCDTKLHRVDELTVDDLPLPALKVVGRGGTDMHEAFQWACQHEDDIDMFVLQTDGAVPELDPNLHPRCPVIIIKTTRAELPAGWDFPVVIDVEV